MNPGLRNPHTRTTSHRQAPHRGFILLPVALALVLVATIAFLLNNSAALDAEHRTADLQARQADTIAGAGLAHAAWGVQHSGCVGNQTLTTVPFGPDSYSAVVQSPTTGSATLYSLNTNESTWLQEASPGTTHQNEPELKVKRVAGDNMQALVQFDLASIPVGSQINSATAWFYVKINDAEGPINLHRVTTNWVAGSATWDSMGDQFDGQAIATIPPQPNNNGWVKVNLTPIVQAWHNGAIPNNGIMLLATSSAIESSYGSQQAATGEKPRLEVVVGNGPASPVKISATGTLTGTRTPANDITRTLTRTDVPAYQPQSTLTLQPGTEGKDAKIYQWKTAWNYGADPSLNVADDGSDSDYHSLLQFNLNRIPRGATILSARLDMHHNGPGTSGGTVGVRRVTSDWIEGSGSGGNAPGVNWNERDSGTAWATPGGDLDTIAYASTTIPGGTTDWFSWDLTELVAGWVSGSYPNQGLALVPESANTWTHFDSSDAVGPTLRPRLTITYACECGSTCLVPQGSGNVLMVVADDDNLTPGETLKKALMESWGYTVDLEIDNASQAAFDTHLASADVVYVSSTVDQAWLGSKLSGATIGVISELGDINDELGIAAGSAWPVGTTINITDPGHYITALFPPGPLDIYTAGMELLTVAGTPAPGLQTLADSGGAGTLVVLDQGSLLQGGGTAAGRRVMLPLGRYSNFNWNYLNSNGQLIVQRALQWGTGNTGPVPPKNVLFVVPDAASLGSQDTVKQALMESWGYTVAPISASDPQTAFDAAIATADVAYVSEEITSANLGTKLRTATIGVVNEETALIDEFGVAATREAYTGTEVGIVSNSHYITAPFVIGPLTIAASATDLSRLTGSPAPDLEVLADSSAKQTLVSLDPGDQLFDGGTAAGRRVQLPWGSDNFDINALNADGQTLMQRALEWGAGAADAPPQTILLVVTDAASPSTQDTARKTLMEGWGYSVRLISASDSQANFDATAAGANVAYVVEQQQSTALGTKLRAADIGVVYEEAELHPDAGFSANRDWPSLRDTVDIVDNSHYITAPFPTGLLTIASAAIEVVSLTGQTAGGLQVLGEHDWGGAQAGLSIIDTGGDLYGGGTAAARRVQLPWGRTGFDINDLNADGLTLMRRAIEWALTGTGGGGGGGGGTPDALTLGAVADSYIDENNNTSNFGTDDFLRNGKNATGKHYQVLVQFDLGSLPAGASISTATLRLYNTGGQGNGTIDIGAYRVTAAWDEATVTWDSFGGGFDTTQQAVTTVTQQNAGWNEWALPPVLIQDWFDSVNPNHGLLLKYEGTQNNRQARPATREWADPAQQPQLVVEYSLP